MCIRDSFYPLPHLSSPPLLLEVGPSNPARGLGSAVSSSSGSGQSPAAKRYFVHFWLKNASGESSFKGTFTKNMFVFSSGGGKGGEGRHPPWAALRRWRHMEERKYGILKFGRFLQIAPFPRHCRQCYFTPLISPNTSPILGPHPQVSVFHGCTQSSVYTKKHY